MSALTFKGWSCSTCGKLHSRVDAAAQSKAEASARQEPPPRGLIVFAERVCEALELDKGGRLFDSVHAAARDGSCGFVALREDAAAAGEEETSARHVSQLLGAVADASPVALRFQGMRVVVLSDTVAVRRVAEQAGATATALAAPAELAAHVCGLLGLPGAAGVEPGSADLALVHLSGRPQATAEQLQALLKQLDAHPDVAPQLYLLLLLGRADPGRAACCETPGLPPPLTHLRPRQSFELAGEAVRQRALLCIHRLGAVVRRDDARRACAAEFEALGARGSILADDVLAEVAYKLGRAPKFGA